MSLYIKTPSTGEPVTVDDVKEHLRIESTDEDYLLEGYISAARQYAENYCRRSFMPQTYEMRIDNFYNNIIELPRPPLSTNSSDVSIEYIDNSGSTQTVPSSIYTVDYRSEPGRIILNYNQSWPSCRGYYDDVRITFRAGYPLDGTSTGGTTPQAIKTWIKMRVGQMYEHREPIIVGSGISVNELPYSFVDGLLDPYVVIEVV